MARVLEAQQPYKLPVGAGFAGRDRNPRLPLISCSFKYYGANPCRHVKAGDIGRLSNDRLLIRGQRNANLLIHSQLWVFRWPCHAISIPLIFHTSSRSHHRKKIGSELIAAQRLTTFGFLLTVLILMIQ